MTDRPRPRPGWLGLALTDLLTLPLLIPLALHCGFQALTTGKYRRSWWRRWGIGLHAGLGELPRPSIWIHAVSVGEVRAAVPVVRALKAHHPKQHVIITTTTETGHDTARQLFPDCSVWWSPWDMAWNVARWYRRIEPSLVIILENDVWPAMVRLAARRGVPVAMINGKLSDRSHTRYQRLLGGPLAGLLRGFWHCIDLICTQTPLDAERLMTLARDPSLVHHTGNVKFDFPPVNVEASELNGWRERLGIRPDQPVIVAGSTHQGEEDLLLRMVDHIQASHGAHLILVPRHPERFNEVWETLSGTGFRCQRWSEPRPDCMVTLVDEMGLLTRLYAMATVAIVCGSWRTDIGGHNILEPAQFGVPVVFGPHMHAQRGMREIMLEAKAGIQIEADDPKGPHLPLVRVLGELLADPDRRRAMGEAGKRAVERTRGAAERSVALLEPLLR